MKRPKKTSEKRIQQSKEWQKKNPEKVLEYKRRAMAKYWATKEERRRPRKVPIEYAKSGLTSYYKEWKKLYPEKVQQYKANYKKKRQDMKASGITITTYRPDYYKENAEKLKGHMKKWVDNNREKVREYQKKHYIKTHPKVEKPKPTYEELCARKLEVKRYNRERYLKIKSGEIVPGHYNTTNTHLTQKEKSKIYYQVNKERIKQKYIEKKNNKLKK